MGRGMETKKLIIIIFPLILFNCDLTTSVRIYNDTGYSTIIDFKKEKKIILPNETAGFGFIGLLPPVDGQETIASLIRENWENGFYIIYLDYIYHLNPDTAASLMIKNAIYDEEKRIYYLNMSEVIKASNKTGHR